MKTYHIGMVKDGDRLIIELARSIDQLSCETWRYLGERYITFLELRKKQDDILRDINSKTGQAFKRITIKKIPNWDFAAGH